MIAETVPPTSASSMRRRIRSTAPKNCPSTADAGSAISRSSIRRTTSSSSSGPASARTMASAGPAAASWPPVIRPPATWPLAGRGARAGAGRGRAGRGGWYAGGPARAGRCPGLPLPAVSPAAEAGIGVAEVGWVGPVHRAQVVEILRPRPLLAALVGGQQRLAEPRHGPALADVPGSDLGDHVGERDAQRQAVGTDPACPGGRAAFVMNLLCDLAGLETGHQAAGADLPGQEDLLLRITSG